MSSIFFDWSGKIDQPTINALSALKKEADALKIPFFVVGATARDLILKQGYGIEPSRLTRDIDLGIKVAGWEQFDRLTNALIATGRFATMREPQRFRFDNLVIDIIPFGAIGDERRRISWPPEHAVFMSVAGFDGGYESSITGRLNADPELDIRLPTLPGLALLKVISWADRYPERSKDADDLVLIMQQYDQAGNLERLYDREPNLLEEEAFDTRLAGIRLLGRDMAMIASPDTAAAGRAHFDGAAQPGSPYPLITRIIRGLPVRRGKVEEIQLPGGKRK